ncbi:MAG TPA: magnesium chelatase subunit D, partial [Hyphomicrobiaceae bacterium]|nr:magnesium chelatase subunit D [Hyphomicrobiaceae bacterium]
RRAEILAATVNAAALFAILPDQLGGISVRAPASAVRDAWISHLLATLPDSPRQIRIPLSVTAQQLDGGIDIEATLAAGRIVEQRGLIESIGSDVAVVAMAERWTGANAAHLAAAIDRSSPNTSRHLRVIALDEGIEDDEIPPPALLERLAFRMSLPETRPSEPPSTLSPARIEEARELVDHVSVPDTLIEGLASCSLALGVASPRALVFALSATRAHAALNNRETATEDDVTAAAALVLAPRATQIPSQGSDDLDDQEHESEQDTEQHPPPESRDAQDPQGDTQTETGASVEDRLVEAVSAALPDALLERLAADQYTTKAPVRDHARSGHTLRAARRGRPIGVKHGDLRHDGPIALTATIMAAVPWQKLRRRMVEQATQRPSSSRRIIFRKSDLRISRFRDHVPMTTIFVVDASGSSALHRMGEAKGAVELMLSDCYVRRDRVALVSFRGKCADVLLPPTRSLTRAKRALSELAGGGTTPLASGLVAALDLTATLRRDGDGVQLVLLTDGRSNVDRAGLCDRTTASKDAIAASRAIAAAGVSCVLIDTSQRPHPQAAAIASAMGARYVPLPHADARDIFGTIRAGHSADGTRLHRVGVGLRARA